METTKVYSDREIKARNLLLKQKREQLDALGKILDTPDLENQRYQLVINKMRMVWKEIQDLKKM